MNLVFGLLFTLLWTSSFVQSRENGPLREENPLEHRKLKVKEDESVIAAYRHAWKEAGVASVSENKVHKRCRKPSKSKSKSKSTRPPTTSATHEPTSSKSKSKSKSYDDLPLCGEEDGTKDNEDDEDDKDGEDDDNSCEALMKKGKDGAKTAEYAIEITFYIDNGLSDEDAGEILVQIIDRLGNITSELIKCNSRRRLQGNSVAVNDTVVVAVEFKKPDGVQAGKYRLPLSLQVHP